MPQGREQRGFVVNFAGSRLLSNGGGGAGSGESGEEGLASHGRLQFVSVQWLNLMAVRGAILLGQWAPWKGREKGCCRRASRYHPVRLSALLEEMMSQTVAVVEALKRALKAKKQTYAQVARVLKMSEASVKRMFSSYQFTLDRFEQVCQIAGLGLTDLAREVDSEKNYISHMTLEQEREVVSNTKLFLIAVCVLNHMTLDQILTTYEIPKAECIQLLLKLDKIKFLELLPQNRIKLKVAPSFAWLPNGPILQYFMARAQSEYFRSRFDGPNEMILVINAMLSPASSARIIAKLRKLANEFTDLHNDDKNLVIGERRPASVVLGLRSWELDEFHKLRRKRKGRAPG